MLYTVQGDKFTGILYTFTGVFRVFYNTTVKMHKCIENRGLAGLVITLKQVKNEVFFTALTSLCTRCTTLSQVCTGVHRCTTRKEDTTHLKVYHVLCWHKQNTI